MSVRSFEISPFAWMLAGLGSGYAAGYAIGDLLTGSTLLALGFAFGAACLATFGVLLVAPGGRDRSSGGAEMMAS